MEKNRFYIGIDFSDRSVMVSCYESGQKEPETISMIAGGESYAIPTLLARRIGQEQWYFGEDAKKNAMSGDVICIDGLLHKAIAGDSVAIGSETYSGKDLLAIFISKVMGLTAMMGRRRSFDRLMITVDHLNKEIIDAFYSILPVLGIPADRFALADHKEAFYYYALSQQQSLWQHDVYLFEYDHLSVRYMELRRNTRTRPQTVSINESSRRTLGEDKDNDFLNLAKSAFEKHIISTVYLVGSGFDGGWMKKSLNYLCKGRRAFIGKNLYSKGACYGAAAGDEDTDWPFLYFGENEMKFNLSLRVMEGGRENSYTLIESGSSWYTAQGSCEVLLGGSPEIDFWKQLPYSRSSEIETLDISDLPIRPDRASRLRIEAKAIANDKVDIYIHDLGFGEFYRSSGKIFHYTMSL